jgi:CheY-like chemotaxis protein
MKQVRNSDGGHVIAHIRQEGNRDNVIHVVCTANTADGERASGFGSGSSNLHKTP